LPKPGKQSKSSQANLVLSDQVAPPKSKREKFIPISIRLHPRALDWLKKEAKKRDVPYQSIINEMLLKFAA